MATPHVLALAAATLSAALALGASRAPVSELASSRMGLMTPAGRGTLPIQVSDDWTKPRPDARRAILVIHGIDRDAGAYFRSMRDAARLAGPAGQGTIIFAPQFLEDVDAALAFDPNILRWRHSRWEGGDPATGPAAISSFEAIDAILLRLADRKLFPNLKQVVLAGHSAGGQTVQRYAVVGRAEAALQNVGIRTRYVVSNPSSYVYFSADRPTGAAGFAPYAGSCADFNQWRYGVLHPPPYIGQASFAALEQTYASRDVIYLLGTADNDPHHHDLDVTCAAEAEGPHRLARGMAYFAYLKARHPTGFTQRLWFVPGVAHNERQMFRSACGLAALFDLAGCQP